LAEAVEEASVRMAFQVLEVAPIKLIHLEAISHTLMAQPEDQVVVELSVFSYFVKKRL
jgi:hypothetical protein